MDEGINDEHVILEVNALKYVKSSVSSLLQFLFFRIVSCGPRT